MSSYVRFDGMTWPNPDALGETEHALRYGQPTRADLLVAASVLGAYRALVLDPQHRRNKNVAGIRRAVSTP